MISHLPSTRFGGSLPGMKDRTIRLQKLLAERGVCSRRAAATCLRDGHVTVNGVVVREAGLRVDAVLDEIRFDGQPLPDAPRKITIMLYKPRGYICSTNATQGRTVYELVHEIPEKLVPVGRLDKNSEGLLLMSNDGDLVNRLTHPRFEHTKTYQVSVTGAVDEAALRILNSRMVLDGYQIQAARVRILKHRRDGTTVLEFRLQEGRNRQIRKMCEIAGLQVHKLVRVKICDLTIRTLSPGNWRPLTTRELALLS
jgi:23S rRNA pseudouridine2605 synthase